MRSVGVAIRGASGHCCGGFAAAVYREVATEQRRPARAKNLCDIATGRGITQAKVIRAQSTDVDFETSNQLTRAARAHFRCPRRWRVV